MIPLMLGTLAVPALEGCSSSRSDSARLALSVAAMSLGEAQPGEELRGAFTVRNLCDAVVQLGEVETGCACARVTLPKTVLQPGEAIPAEVTVSVREEGQRLQFYVRFYSKNEQELLAELPVSAAGTQPVLKLDPAEVDFGQISLGSSPRRSVSVSKLDGTPWPATEAMELTLAGNSVRCELASRGVRDQAATRFMEVQARSDLPIGPFRDTLTVRPTHSQRSVALTIRGEVVPRLVVSPTTLYYADVDQSGGPMVRYFLIRRTDGQVLGPMVRFQAPAGLMVEEVSGTMPASHKRLRATLQPGSQKEEIKDGKILIWLDGESETVAVGLMVFRSRKS